MKPALGIDLGGTKIEALLLGDGGRELWRRRIATPQGSYEASVAAMASLVGQARAQAQMQVQAQSGQAAGTGELSIGIGTPGSLTPAGLMKNCNSTLLNGRPLRHDIEAAVGQPVAMANDANCLALSEATDGAGAAAEVVFAVIVGTGTGAGIALRGQVHGGPNGLAGEWGHNPLPWAEPADDPAPRCYCGQAGCIETWLSGPGISRDHLAKTGECSTAESIALRATAGDAACQATLERHASRMARALASVINLLDPEVIVLGGGVSRMAHLYERVPALWARWVFCGGSADPVRTRLLPSRHGDASGVRGAAWLGAGLAAATTAGTTTSA